MSDARGAAAGALTLGVLLTLAGPSARAEGTPVAIFTDADVTPAAVAPIRKLVASRRAIREELPPPKPGAMTATRAKDEQRIAAIRLALDRARSAKADADWDGCVREAETAVGDAIDLLASAGEVGLLRDLHVESGTCLTLAGHVQDAPVHFAAATLLDESEPERGRNKEAAEKALAAVRADVLLRRKGKVHVESLPAGAEVWIDGRKQAGVTPMDVEVRAGDHFVTLRRFRYEPHTERRVLQPDGAFRVVLDPASRLTIEEQLASIPTPPPPADELLLARAIYFRAEQALVVRRSIAKTLRLDLFDAATGALMRTETVDPTLSESRLQPLVCRLLGETCDAKSGGVPWWVWPVVGGVVASAAAVTTGIILYENRDLAYCPTGGCR